MDEIFGVRVGDILKVTGRKPNWFVAEFQYRKVLFHEDQVEIVSEAKIVRS